MHIAFENVDVTPDGVLHAEVVTEVRRELLVHLPWSFTPADDLVALAFSTFVGRRFESITLDLALGPACREAIEEATGAEVQALPGRDRRRRPGSVTALGFSGGFDSLAARAVLSPDTQLLSLDLQGTFARERGFFERFSPHVLASNLVELGLNRHMWTFMLFGSLLMRDELDLATYATGGILGSSLPSVLRRGIDQATGILPQFRHVGMTVFNPVAGVTETGALAIVARTDPALIPGSLASLAGPDSTKTLRKRLMIEAVLDRIDVPMPRLPDPMVTPRSIWGANYANDLSSLFVIKQLGVDVVGPSYAGGVPASVEAALHDLSLDLDLRVNPDAYLGVPNDRLATLYERLASLGIRPWGRRDWEEAVVVDMLVRTGDVPAGTGTRPPASTPVDTAAPAHMVGAGASRPQGRPTDS